MSNAKTLKNRKEKASPKSDDAQKTTTTTTLTSNQHVTPNANKSEIATKPSSPSDSPTSAGAQTPRSHSKHNEFGSIHSVRDSLLSSASGFINYRGVLNLCVVLLVMSSGRLVLENLIKYGFLVRFDLPILFITDPTAWPATLACLVTNVFICIALSLEKKMEKYRLSEKTGTILCHLNMLTALILPAVYLWYRKTNPFASFFGLAIYTCLTLKLFSYHQVNKWLRLARNVAAVAAAAAAATSTKLSRSASSNDPISKTSLGKKKSIRGGVDGDESDEEIVHDSQEPQISYPQNLTHKNIYYFMAVPTLCYEINFPRTKRIRKRFLFRRILEIVFLFTLQLILIQQWMVPILQNSKIPFRETNLLKIVERVLKLAIPNHIIWLFGFYAFFHSYLNIIAEVLRFGDREFYKDWWNSDNVSDFWKNWNTPVHNFCVRHIYIPLLKIGVTKFQSTVIVFFMSAFFHEYLVSIPLRMFRLWAFFGMIMQIPFSVFVKKFLHGNYGNMAVWVSLIIGQPAAIMMYIHDYYIDYFRNAAD